MSPDIPASIKARLLNRAKASGDQLELFLVRYACERFLYRLGESAHRERCVLKGAGLLTVWMGDPYRATRDLDFLAYGPNNEESIRTLVETICAVQCPEDGLTFDLTSLDVSPIRAEDEYQGQRVVVRSFLGNARIRVQVDFGFGDAISPGPEEIEYPTLLHNLPAPRLRAYSREASLAEKFQAMVHLGRRNSRMKDFHDVWALSSAFAFEGPALRRAIVTCLDRRGTAWIEETPDALGSDLYAHRDLQARWMAYLRAGAFQVSPPESFEMIGERVRQFLGAVRESVIANDPFDVHWSPGGPWR